MKLFYILLGVIPLIGPIMLAFIFDDTPSQNKNLRNKDVGYYGTNREHHEALQKRLRQKISEIESESDQR